ncbi:hypothetical protein [Duganella vulcania]|uniref:Uncharacterized protein n=1 Tax=Duganella vulcania TaxID=2692166 RepID=A0A845GHH5_9BURK|nr:hypothetical protein [Duganella vulcania]MYM92478.1 hypothetical protein [Duganella vulcania]
MKPCTVAVITGYDQKPHFAIVHADQPGWPLALLGFATGLGMTENRAQAEFFAAAPTMFELLEHMTKEVVSLNTTTVLPPGHQAKLSMLAERAAVLVARHAKAR